MAKQRSRKRQQQQRSPAGTTGFLSGGSTRLPLVFGIATLLLSLGGAIVLGAVSTSTTCVSGGECINNPSWFAEPVFETGPTIYFALALGLSVAITAGAVGYVLLHLRRRVALGVIWGAALVLTLLAFISVIGVAFMSAVPLAWGTAISTLRASPPPAPSGG